MMTEIPTQVQIDWPWFLPVKHADMQQAGSHQCYFDSCKPFVICTFLTMYNLEMPGFGCISGRTVISLWADINFSDLSSGYRHLSYSCNWWSFCTVLSGKTHWCGPFPSTQCWSLKWHSRTQYQLDQSVYWKAVKYGKSCQIFHWDEGVRVEVERDDCIDSANTFSFLSAVLFKGLWVATKDPREWVCSKFECILGSWKL